MACGLFEKDWRFLLDTIYHLNTLDDYESLRKETLKYLRLEIPFNQGIFYTHRFVNGEITPTGPPYVLGDEALYLEEFHEKYDDDALLGRYLLATHCEVFRDTDVFPDEERTQTDWYRDIYVKQGIHYALRAYLIHDDVSLGEIDLFRPKEADDFSETDTRILEMLAPHLAMKLWELLYSRDGAPAEHTSLARELANMHGLTPREVEVIEAIAGGAADRDVADRLCITASTLKKHVHNAYRKMGISNRRQLFAAVQALER